MRVKASLRSQLKIRRRSEVKSAENMCEKLCREEVSPVKMIKVSVNIIPCEFVKG
jgi:hypothetical protein